MLFTENYFGDKLEDQTGRACGTNGELKINTKFQPENAEEILWTCTGFFWQPDSVELVNTTMNPRVHQKMVNLLTRSVTTY